MSFENTFVSNIISINVQYVILDSEVFVWFRNTLFGPAIDELNVFFNTIKLREQFEPFIVMGN